MKLENICIGTYDFSADERYMAGIVLEYLGESPYEEQKRYLRNAVEAREGLEAFMVEALAHTGADGIAVIHPDDLSEEAEKYKEIVDKYQKKLRPEVFALNASAEFMRFLRDCLESA